MEDEDEVAKREAPSSFSPPFKGKNSLQDEEVI